MNQDNSDKLGTTGEQIVSDSMKHLDSFLFDVLSDPDLEYVENVPVESVTAPAVEAPADDETMFTVKPGAQITVAGIQAVTSKTALRMIIASSVSQKPAGKVTKEFLMTVLNTAVARLNELSE